MIGAVERLLIEGRDGRRRLLRILSRRRAGRYVALELAPRRRRWYQAGCLRLAEVPPVYCGQHEHGAAG